MIYCLIGEYVWEGTSVIYIGSMISALSLGLPCFASSVTILPRFHDGFAFIEYDIRILPWFGITEYDVSINCEGDIIGDFAGDQSRVSTLEKPLW